MKLVKFENEKKFIKEFVNFPKTLYSSDNLTQDGKETEKLLLGTHPLSGYFKAHKFLVYDEKKVVGRFVVTFYDGDENAYIGFYECIDNDETAKFIFDNAACFAKKNGKIALVGPVDCSFWIKYRLKINMFDKKPYTGEPYNLGYYEAQFSSNGFEVIEHYTSNVYEHIGKDYVNEKFEQRFETFSKMGYEIKSLEKEKFDEVITDVYYLLSKLYKDFPVYKEITLENFLSMFSSFKQAVVSDMVKLAYYDGKMVGFFISVPDYGVLTSNINLKKLVKIIKIKKSPKKFVMLYMGVDQNHKGLGKALAYSVLKQLKNYGASGIGALTMDGKVTQNYAEDIIDDRYEYVLLRRQL